MFIISKLAIALVSPLGTALFGGLLAMLLGTAGRRRLACGLGLLALLWLWFWSLPMASDWVWGYLENQHPAIAVEAMPGAQAIVVLGGGVSPPDYGGVYPNLESGADRVWYGARLLLAGKAPLVLLSGGSDPAHSATSEAEALSWFMRDLGVPAEALVTEQRSRNTTENAEYSAAILAKQGIDRILLVTSALHMPRAKALFEAQGLTVIPAATYHEVQDRPCGVRCCRKPVRWMAVVGRLRNWWGVGWGGRCYRLLGAIGDRPEVSPHAYPITTFSMA